MARPAYSDEAGFSDLFARMYAAYETDRNGSARQCQWQAEDGWIIAYTTTRVMGGPFHDRWAVMAYKPVGKGARSGRGKASEWRRVYSRGFATRKAARRQAEKLYYRHSPKLAAKHGRA